MKHFKPFLFLVKFSLLTMYSFAQTQPFGPPNGSVIVRGKLNIPHAASGQMSDSIAVIDSTGEIRKIKNTLGIGAETARIDKLLNGGRVTWLGDYNYNIAPATYIINSQTYSSPSTNITLAAADSTNNRVDVFVLTTSGTAVAITGTPSNNPQQADYDHNTSLLVSFAIVEAATTAPSNPIREWLYKDNMEWTTAVNNASINPNSTNTPSSGTKDVEGTNVANGHNLTLTHSAFDITPYNGLSLEIKSKANWSTTKKLVLQWFNETTPVGNPVAIGSSSYGFASNVTTGYQLLKVPLEDFGNISTVTQLRIQASNSSGTMGFLIDNIQLQYNVLLNNSGDGTVTNVTASGLSGVFNTSVINSTTTPAISFSKVSFAGHSFYGNNSGSPAAPVAVQPATTDLSDFPSQTGNDGKFLSTNGSALSWITAAQIQSDWTQSDSAALDYIKNKPTSIPTTSNLQVVTNNGNTTTNYIDAAGFKTPTSGMVNISEAGISLKSNNNEGFYTNGTNNGNTNIRAGNGGVISINAYIVDINSANGITMRSTFFQSPSNSFISQNFQGYTTLKFNGSTASAGPPVVYTNPTITFPAKSGTVALLDDITEITSESDPVFGAHVASSITSTDITNWNAKESALTFSTGLNRSTNTITATLATGKLGGQSVIGGTNSGENLTLSSTTNGTKGKIILGNSFYEESTDRLLLSDAAGLTPGFSFEVAGTAPDIVTTRYSNDTGSPTNRQRKARGTATSPLTVVNGDNIGSVTYSVYDGTTFRNTATIKAVVNGTVATNSVPTDIVFSAGLSNATATEAMRISSNKNVSFTGTITAGTWNGTAIEDAYISSSAAWNAKQNAITTGTTAQYFRGDLSLATFPTNVSGFTNDAGYVTATSTTTFTNKSGSNSQWTNDEGYIKTSDLSGYLTSATAASTYVPLTTTVNGHALSSNVTVTASDIGATTIGNNFITLTNPSAITFPRINADNTVTALSASSFRTAIGAGTGNGDALTTNPLSQFASTTSAQLATVLSDETGSGNAVFSTSPTLTTPILGVASATSVSLTGTAGSGAIYLPRQSTAAATPTSGGGLNLYTDANGYLNIIGTDGFSRPILKEVAEQTYNGTATWTGTTAPSGTTNNTYRWTQVGGMVTLRMNFDYLTTGSGITNVTFTLPSDCPNPVEPTAFTNASNVLYYGLGGFAGNKNNPIPNNCKVSLNNNASHNGYLINVNMPTTSAQNGWINITYFTY
jgi:hypothetical protein